MKTTIKIMILPVMFSLAGCASGANIQLEELKNLPSGRVTEYQRMIENSEQSVSSDDLLYRAAAENDVIGQEFQLFDPTQPLPDGDEMSKIFFHEDGTVTGAGKEFENIGSPKHWQNGVSKLRLCWEESCEFYSSWGIRSDLSEKGSLKLNMHLEGLLNNEPPVVLTLQGSRSNSYSGVTLPADEYTPPVFDEDGNVTTPVKMH